MDENKKPRICEVLGVEVNEEWILDIPPYNDIANRINAAGDRETKDHAGKWDIAGWEAMLIAAINHPESIKRKPRWTEDDIADAKAVRRLWPEAWSVKHGRAYMDIFDSDGALIAYLGKKLFPSIQPNKTVNLDVILEAEQ